MCLRRNLKESTLKLNALITYGPQKSVSVNLVAGEYTKTTKGRQTKHHSTTGDIRDITNTRHKHFRL